LNSTKTLLKTINQTSPPTEYKVHQLKEKFALELIVLD
jgi:hypothetical protein